MLEVSRSRGDNRSRSRSPRGSRRRKSRRRRHHHRSRHARDSRSRSPRDEVILIPESSSSGEDEPTKFCVCKCSMVATFTIMVSLVIVMIFMLVHATQRDGPFLAVETIMYRLPTLNFHLGHALGLLFFAVVTCLFWFFEDDMSPLDAFYLTFMTLSTIGYGDIYPKTAGGKILFMLTASLGLGIFGLLFNQASTWATEAKEKDKVTYALQTTALAMGIGTGVFMMTKPSLSLLDALYYAVATATTVGFGDIVPESPGEKIAVMIYAAFVLDAIAHCTGVLVSWLDKIPEITSHNQQRKMSR